jgi:phosphoglycolate phosphatase-like HAD superfamily hydrolase
MITYSDLDIRKKAFIFELDNVLFPQKDYFYQVYYLFANFLEYQEMLDNKVLTRLMIEVFEKEGADVVFDRLQQKFQLDIKYKENFNRLLSTARLPLKLLLFQQMLSLLQDIVVDRKSIFIITNGDPELQLNKIRQTEWHGLEKYLTCYFADEIMAKPEPDSIIRLLKDHQLERRDLMIIGCGHTDELFAEACGVDFVNASQIIT